jgi:hypothetical protein
VIRACNSANVVSVSSIALIGRDLDLLDQRKHIGRKTRIQQHSGIIALGLGLLFGIGEHRRQVVQHAREYAGAHGVHR